MNKVSEHYDNLSNQYDKAVITFVPEYNAMLDSCVGALPFPSSEKFSALDMGCGTGNLGLRLFDNYPNMVLTCLDTSEKMIGFAKNKLSSQKNTRFITNDVTSFEFTKKYDLITSILVFHNLSDDDKRALHKRIFTALNKGGVYCYGGIFLADTGAAQEENMKKWVAFMKQTMTENEVEENVLSHYRAKDYPSRLTDEFQWLSETGFSEPNIIWECCNFAVIVCKK